MVDQENDLFEESICCLEPFFSSRELSYEGDSIAKGALICFDTGVSFEIQETTILEFHLGSLR